jgi:hypothetical protein
MSVTVIATGFDYGNAAESKFGDLTPLIAPKHETTDEDTTSLLDLINNATGSNK